ncbi:SDR family NAD(P)-dependent oxidoreductase [Nocardia sp. NPDC057227]|uniref:SDR family NAD(P)-dependent oxidoreductase n=1 Tax=Nocardia sp. NPDC057227 TaxID=3346056 RepID=UPI00364300BE
MSTRTVLITGATAGIGLECAAQIAPGAHLVLVGRSEAKLAAAADRVRAHGAAGVHTLTADFAELDSVRALAAAVLDRGDPIDVLVNNAGAVFAARTETVDGYEATFAVNHLAPYLLTETLEPLLLASAPARVVITASTGHYRGDLDFDDLQYQRGGYSIMKAYARSKLANVIYARSLAEELAGAGVTVNAVHPGMVATDIWDGAPRLARPLLALVKRFRMISPEEGGHRLCTLATDPALAETTGRYFEDGAVVEPSAVARDLQVARRLRRVSDELVAPRH